MIGKPKVVEFNRLCPKDWGRYDPREPLKMKDLIEQEKNKDTIEIGE